MCQAQNEAGINTYTYEILVYAPPSFENTTLNQTTVKAISAKNFSIDCPVNAYPPPDVSKNAENILCLQISILSIIFQIEWTHDGKVISSEEKLFIENVSKTDQGQYVFTAKNEHGTASIQFNLSVLSEFFCKSLLNSKSF